MLLKIVRYKRSTYCCGSFKVIKSQHSLSAMASNAPSFSMNGGQEQLPKLRISGRTPAFFTISDNLISCFESSATREKSRKGFPVKASSHKSKQRQTFHLSMISYNLPTFFCRLWQSFPLTSDPCRQQTERGHEAHAALNLGFIISVVSRYHGP